MGDDVEQRKSFIVNNAKDVRFLDYLMTDTPNPPNPPDDSSDLPTDPDDGAPISGDAGAAGDGADLDGAVERDPSLAVQLIEIQDEMERSFLEYAMSVIMARALPDVQRRSQTGAPPHHLWSMVNAGLHVPNRTRS